MTQLVQPSPEPGPFTPQVLYGGRLETFDKSPNKLLEKEFHAYVRKLMAKGWEPLGEGRHRWSCAHPNTDTVIKVSRNLKGIEANLTECHYANLGTEMTVQFYWSANLVTVPIPKAFGHSRVGLLSVLTVEWVDRIGWDDAEDLANEFPWIHEVDSDGDGPQVGYTKDGRLVCFDWCTF